MIFFFKKIKLNSGLGKFLCVEVALGCFQQNRPSFRCRECIQYTFAFFVPFKYSTHFNDFLFGILLIAENYM